MIALNRQYIAHNAYTFTSGMVYNPAMIREDKKLFIPSLLTSKNGIYRYQMKRTCLLIRYAEFQGCHSKKKPKVRIIQIV